MVEASQGLPALLDYIGFDVDQESKKLIGNGKKNFLFIAFVFVNYWQRIVKILIYKTLTYSLTY